MTLPASDARSNHVGNGTTTAFIADFKIDHKSETQVLVDGVEKVLDVDYTITGENQDEHTVTFGTAPAADAVVTLLRKQPISQQTDYIRNEPFPSERVELDLDDIVKMIQMLQEQLNRALKFNPESTFTLPILPDGEEGKIVKWKSETELENVDPADFLVMTVAGVPVTLPLAVNQGGTAATSASAARTSLAVPGLADQNTFTARNIWKKGADLASAATVNLGTDGNYFRVTGTTTITAIGNAVAGLWFILQFAGNLTLTHSTTLRLPYKQNIAVKPQDIALFVADGAADVRCVSYIKANDDATESEAVFYPGLMLPTARSSAPTGWLLCDGTAVSRTTYAALFAAISTTYGSGDGSTTFNVPDCRGRALYGKAASGTFQNLGATGGAETLPNHTHSTPAHTHTLAEGAAVANSDTSVANVVHDGSGSMGTATGTSATKNRVSSTTESSGSGTSGNPGTSPSVMNPFIVVNYLIKT